MAITARRAALERLSRCIVFLVATAACNAQTESTPDSIVIPHGTPVVLLLTGTLDNRDHAPQHQIVVAQDVVIDGITIIAAGEPVQYSIIRKRPRRFNMPGSLSIEITSVRLTSGWPIRLRGSHKFSGRPACFLEDCMILPSLFWLKGDPGQMEGGLLLNAWISENRELSRQVFSAPKSSAATSFALVHFYQPAPVNQHPYFIKTFSTIKLDGITLGDLGDGQYACWAVMAGSHELKVGHDKFTFTFAADAGMEYFFRISTPPRDCGPYGKRIIEQTEGYQFWNNTLKPGLFGLPWSSCFVAAKKKSDGL